MRTASMPAHRPHLIVTQHIGSGRPISSQKVNHPFLTDKAEHWGVSMSTLQLQDDAGVSRPSPCALAEPSPSHGLHDEPGSRTKLSQVKSNAGCALLNQARVHVRSCSAPDLFDTLRNAEGAALKG